MNKRQNILSGVFWEDKVGYSRAVKMGNVIEVSGTTAYELLQENEDTEAYRQTVFILKKIEQTLQDAGATLNDVIRTRMYVTDISNWEEVGRAHHEFFKNIKPAATMVEVSSLINADLLVEIEVTAVIAGKA